MERWSSGLRHTLGKRAMLIASGGSNPLLSAIVFYHALDSKTNEII